MHTKNPGVIGQVELYKENNGLRDEIVTAYLGYSDLEYLAVECI